jgi:hypothetical protein
MILREDRSERLRGMVCCGHLDLLLVGCAQIEVIELGLDNLICLQMRGHGSKFTHKM